MADDVNELSPDVLAVFEGGKPVYYANSMNLVSSLHDIQLSFGKGNPLRTSYDVHIYLSPPGAKQLALMLSNSIKNYEENFGEINLEPSKKEP
ncbi:MAG: DUF3467 domain-containing protein [Alphaproteobacteria bacterium]